MSQSKFRTSLRVPDGGIPPAPIRARAHRCERLWQPAAVLAAVTLLHAAVLYTLWHRPRAMPVRVAAPLSVTMATAVQSRAAQKLPVPRRPATPSEQAQRPTADTQAPATARAAPSETLAPDTSATAASEAESAAISAPRFDAAYLNNPPPDYPTLSRRLGEQGRVVLRVFVTPQGRASEVHIERSSGHARLDRAATEAVGRWRFVPAARDAEPVGAWVLVPISFALKQG